MQKKFFITEISEQNDHKGTPMTDRFRRIEQLNDLLALGWTIKSMEKDSGGTFFLIEKV